MPEKVLQVHPHTDDVPGLDGILDAMRARHTNGVAELSALLEEHPDSILILGHLSWARAQVGDYEGSIALCLRFLELMPENFEMRWRIADRLVNLGRLDEAAAAYQSVLDEHPDCIDARIGLRYVHHLRRRGKGPVERYRPLCREETPLQLANREKNEREYKEQRLRLESLPPWLYLESTKKCNFYCRTCSKGYAPYDAEDLDDDIFEAVKRDLLPAVVRISLTGFGEPTLASDFDRNLMTALENGSVVHFVTNASLLNFDRIEKLTQYPVDITISFDGATKETFESVRAGANFDLIMEKLYMIQKLRDINSSSFYSLFRFNFVALRQNIHELSEVVRIAHRVGIHHVGVADYALNDTEFDRESLRYDPDLANRCIAEAKQVAAALGVELHTPPRYEPSLHASTKASILDKFRAACGLLPKRNRFPQRCSSPWSEPYIHVDGRVTPCCASGQYLGNLKKQSFSQIWNGWRYRMLRWRIHSPLPPLGCRICFLHWGINGGNIGNVMAKEGLLVKLWYYLEGTVARWVVRGIRKGLRRTMRLFRRAPGPPASAPERPRYYRGKPLTDRNRPGGKQGSGS